MELRLLATPEEPLHLADRLSAGNYSATLEYAPGTALRGAFAAAYLTHPDLQQQAIERLRAVGWSFDDYFRWLFLSGLVRFRNLYPKSDKASWVIPLSARSCKRYGGFAYDDERPLRETHAVYDVLLGEPEVFRCPADYKGHSKCDAPMEPFHAPQRRFYESSDASAQSGRMVRTARRVLTRTAIENATEMVRQGALYSLESIEEGGGGHYALAGSINADAPVELAPQHQQALLALLREHVEKELSVIFIGAARTRGLGRLRLVLEGDPLMLPSIEERFDELQKAWSKAHPEMPNEPVFTLTLNSDAVVMDELWRYCSVLDERAIKREYPSAPECKLQHPCFTGTRVVAGWNSAHRLPKEDEMAIVKGAAFLYTTEADTKDLLSWLAQVEERGIGERRNEGFGQLIACHPFHREVAK